MFPPLYTNFATIFIVWHIIFNKQDCNTSKVDHSALILYRSKQPTATSTSHVIAIYMPETNMPVKVRYIMS